MDVLSLDARQLQALLESPTPPVLLDLLPPEVYAAQHIPGAQNACVYEVGFVDRVRQLVSDASRPLVVYGSSGSSRDAEAAVAKLATAGYRELGVLTGGRSSWQRAGYPFTGPQADALWVPRPEPVLPDGEYVVDPEQSVIHWVGRSIGGRQQGTLKLQEGRLAVRGGQLLGGACTIDLGSIQVESLDETWAPVLIRHLQSEDFFEVAHFPWARFTMERIEPLAVAAGELPKLHLSGLLELHGHTDLVECNASLAPHREGGLALEAHFDLDRTRWGVIYGSARFYEHLGKHRVDHIISVEVRLRAR